MSGPDDQLEFDHASEEDWPRIWSIFREVVRTGETYPYLPDTDDAQARAVWLQDGPDRRHTYIARLDDRIVATAYLKQNLPGLGDHVANAGWMVAPTCAGRGIGRRFARFVLDEARRLEYRSMQFNAVVATNEPAIALWRSLGFEIIGTVPEAFRHARHGLTPVHIMFRMLEP